MRTFFLLILALGIGGALGAALTLRLGARGPSPSGLDSSMPDPVSESSEGAALEVKGKTQAAPGRKALIAPVPLHPVVGVLVKPGDRVKKEQPLVKLDDDEPQADLRAKKANLAEMKASLARLKAQPREEERAELRALLESARVSSKWAREVLDMLKPVYSEGATSKMKFFEARSALLKTAADERAAIARLQQVLKRPIKLEIAEMQAKVNAAQAAVDVARAELEHYTVTAPIDGVVSWLDVYPGTVSRPGTTVWGEILDLSEIEVRCELTARQAERVSVGEKAAVRLDGSPGAQWPGQVVFVGIAADPRSGRVPVRVKVANPRGRLRCNVEVTVRFGAGG
jgi:multidrug resistance efflux pump